MWKRRVNLCSTAIVMAEIYLCYSIKTMLLSQCLVKLDLVLR
jgi:hypothetical protein